MHRHCSGEGTLGNPLAFLWPGKLCNLESSGEEQWEQDDHLRTGLRSIRGRGNWCDWVKDGVQQGFPLRGQHSFYNKNISVYKQFFAKHNNLYLNSSNIKFPFTITLKCSGNTESLENGSHYDIPILFHFIYHICLSITSLCCQQSFTPPH